MVIDLTGIASLLAVAVFSIALRVGIAEIRAHVKNAWLRDLLESALGNALGKMQQATREQIETAAILHPTVSNPLLAVGVQYVVARAEDAPKQFGLNDVAIAEAIEARLGVAEINTNLAVAASALPLTPAPLDKLPVFPAGSMTTADLNNASAALEGVR